METRLIVLLPEILRLNSRLAAQNELLQSLYFVGKIGFIHSKKRLCESAALIDCSKRTRRDIQMNILIEGLEKKPFSFEARQMARLAPIVGIRNPITDNRLLSRKFTPS